MLVLLVLLDRGNTLGAKASKWNGVFYWIAGRSSCKCFNILFIAVVTSTYDELEVPKTKFTWGQCTRWPFFTCRCSSWSAKRTEESSSQTKLSTLTKWLQSAFAFENWKCWFPNLFSSTKLNQNVWSYSITPDAPEYCFLWLVDLLNLDCDQFPSRGVHLQTFYCRAVLCLFHSSSPPRHNLS